MDVVQVMARALDSLVSGEIMQIKANGAADKKSSEDKNENSEPMNGKRSFLDRAKAALNVGRSQDALHRVLAERDARVMELYLRKSYYKTASLIGDASRSCALLAGHASTLEVARPRRAATTSAWRSRSSTTLWTSPWTTTSSGSRPALICRWVWLTAPILFAAQDHPELRPLIERRFKGDGDVTMAYETVRASTGMDLARKLAGFHAQRAVDAICRVAPDSEARDALISICYIVLSRNK